MAISWHHGPVTTEGPPQPSLDELVAELALVREAGLEPLEVEALVPSLPCHHQNEDSRPKHMVEVLHRYRSRASAI